MPPKELIKKRSHPKTSLQSLASIGNDFGQRPKKRQKKRKAIVPKPARIEVKEQKNELGRWIHFYHTKEMETIWEKHLQAVPAHRKALMEDICVLVVGSKLPTAIAFLDALICCMEKDAPVLKRIKDNACWLHRMIETCEFRFRSTQ